MQSLHGKCLRRTKAARVKSDSGNRRLTPLRGCVSLPVRSCLHFCLALAAPSMRFARRLLNIPFPLLWCLLFLPSPPIPAHLASGSAGVNWICLPFPSSPSPLQKDL